MKRSIKHIAISQVILLSLFIISCDGNNNSNVAKDSKEVAETHNDAKFNSKEEEKDAQFLVEAYSENLFEIELSKHAKEKAMRKEVQDFASEIILSDARMNEEIKSIADKKQISLQEGLTEEQLDEIKKYGNRKGNEFDQPYLQKLVECHEKMVKKAEEITEDAKDRDIHELFSTVLPELRKYLDETLTMRDRTK